MKFAHAFLFFSVLIVVMACVDLSVHAVDPQLGELAPYQQLRLYEGDPPGDPVWDKGTPVPGMTVNERGNYRFVHEPVLDVYHAKAEGRTGAAVVICPGGGYGTLAYRHEGVEIARWLNKHGITGVILRYRMYPYRHPVPMMDVHRALQTVRAKSDDWALNPGKIGVLGFSAGGHLASTAAVHHEPAEPDSKDPIERVSSRPDFAVLIYPVVTMRRWTHGGSKRNLLGPDPTDDLVALLSNEEQIDEDTPPTFLVHSKDDRAVPIKNSEQFLAALNKHKVPGELMVFETGGHGYGMGRGRNDPEQTHETDAWPKRCIEWLGEIGMIDSDQ
ncbi:MAG: alpha/beta hydrolase [Planctomycetota bacterium]